MTTPGASIKALRKELALPMTGFDLEKELEQIQQDYRSGRLNRAQRACRDVLQIEPENETVIRQLGVISHRLEDFECAKECFFGLTKITPDDPSVFYNLGHTCIGLGDLDLAFAAFAKTIEIDPDRAAAYNNMGVILEKRGDFEDAIDYFYEASELDADHALSRMHLAQTLSSVHRLRESNEVIENSLSVNTLSPEQRGELLIRQAVNSWLEGNLEACRRVLKLCEHVLPHIRDSADLQRRLEMIDALLEYRKENSECYQGKASPGAYYFSNSHALVPANTLIELDDINYRVESFYIENASVINLNQASSNKNALSFIAALDQVPDKSWVFVDFGEQICRATGELFKFYKKYNAVFTDHLQKVVTNHLDFIKQQVSSRKIKLIVVGVPAINSDLQDLSVDDQQKLLSVVEKFNSMLEKQATQQGFYFLDYFTATVGENGKSNKQFHMGEVVLAPSALAEIVSKYLLHKPH